ncbi:MAG: lipase family protein [Bacteroidetes bacterium]|nr:lipase family protein [Bacteroidota bacterium]
MKIKLLSWWLLSFMLMLMLGGCGLFADDDVEDEVDVDEPIPEGNAYFVSAESKATLTKDLLEVYAAEAGAANLIPIIEYDVSFYKIIYNTTYKGNPVEASGLLAIPLNTPAAPALLSAQHGTMTLKSRAPSNFPATFSKFELGAAAGLITLVPDYLGFGKAEEVFHPYYDEEHAATAVIDLIKAAKYFLQQEQIAFSEELFLLGYSEGGYVTMAAQKEIETNPAHQLSLTGVVAGAGGYDLSGMLNSIATRPVYNGPALLANLVLAYNTTYDWDRPLTDFFKEPYASEIPALFNGSAGIGEINRQLPNEPAALFNPTFYANLRKPGEGVDLKEALAHNSLLDWVPQSPTRLYHGTADETVFFENSEATFNHFVAAGATSVVLIPIEGGTHGSSTEPMVLDALQWMQSLNE